MKPMNAIMLMLALTLALSACNTSKMAFQNSTIVPAARGNVHVKKDRNQNYTIDVSVQNLAEPQRLTPARDLYLVWMESDRRTTKKLGQINTSSGTFSKALKASLTATAIDKPYRVFITAENNADVSYPTGTVVLTTSL